MVVAQGGGGRQSGVDPIEMRSDGLN